MIGLPNGNRCSELSVYPKNWKTAKANPSVKWKIRYRFYEEGKRPKPIKLMGMNWYHDLKTKQAITLSLLQDELQLLKSGYNPNLKQPVQECDTAEMSLTDALLFALDKADLEAATRKDMTNTLRYVLNTAKELRLDRLPISQIRRKQVLTILNKATDKKTANTFNNYRKYLSILFTVLITYEAIEFNPVDKYLPKRKTVKKIRQTLTLEERVFVNDHLFHNYYNFWRFLQIFYHGGVRETELMRVQKEHVNLSRQEYKTTIKKGRQQIEVLKIITDEALPYWQELLSSANRNDYVFSKGLSPGPVQIKAYQITKRWYRLIKKSKNEEIKALHITADFYSLKHTKATKVSAALGTKKAAELDSHRSEAMVIKIYDVEHQQRKDNELKSLKTPFTK